MKFNKFLQSLSLLLCLGASEQSFAKWFEASGTADASVQDIKIARQEAISDALRSIALESGANVNFSQSLIDGRVTTETFSITSSSAIKKVTVLEEQKVGEIITVKVRAYVDENFNKCGFAKVKKSILPIMFRYLDNEAFQSSAGIESINKEISLNFLNKLADSNALRVAKVSNANYNISSALSSVSEKDQRNLNNLAKNNNSQYILLGTINSVSLSEIGSNKLARYLYKPTRNIDFSISLYDSQTGDIVFNKDYKAVTDWDFERGENIDIRSVRFTNSNYAQRLRQLVGYAVEDVSTAIQCIAPTAHIIKVEGDDVIINIGKTSGVAIGQEYNVSHISSIRDREGNLHSNIEGKSKVYTVSEVYPNAAKLRPKNINDGVINIQLDDIVVLK